MLPRVVGIPAAIVVLVSAPSLIVRPEPAEVVVVPAGKPATQKPTGELKLRIAGESGGTRRPVYVRLAAAGRPPAQPAQLVDAAGLHAATVANAPGHCGGKPLRITGAGLHEWCLSISGVDAGHELSGTAAGGTAVELIVSRRNDFDGRPLLVLLLGFLTALALPLLSARLRGFVGRLAVARLLSRNRKAGADRVGGLDDWVHEREAAGASAGEVFPIVSKIVTTGAKTVRAARAKLAEALPPQARDEPRYVTEARKEATTDTFVVGDFLDGDGKLRETTRADAWRTNLRQLGHDRELLEQLDEQIARTLLAECRREPLAATRKAWALFRGFDTPDKIKSLDEAIAAANLAYNAKRLDSGCRPDPPAPVSETFRGNYFDESWACYGDTTRPTLVVARRNEMMHTLTRAVNLAKVLPVVQELRSVSTPAMDLKGGLLELETWFGWFGILLGVIATLAFAGVAVWNAAYEPKPAFAGFSDYFALFSAALASGAAAGVLALLGYWRPEAAKK